MLLRPNLYLIALMFVSPLILGAENKQENYTSTVIDSFRNHIIVLIDRSGSMKRSGRMDQIEQLITHEIPKILFEKGIVIPQKALLQNKDYLSIAFFGLGNYNSYDYKNYINQELTIGDDKVIGKMYSRIGSPIVFDSLWREIKNNYGLFFSGNFTGLSFAGPLGFNFFKGKDKKVNRTFVLIISDGQFHLIDDPSSEIKLKSIRDADEEIHLLSNNKHIEDIYSIVKGRYIWHPKLLTLKFNRFNLNLYEYIPNQLSLAIRSKLKFPVEINLERRPTGYEHSFAIVDSDTADIFIPQKVLVRIISQNTKDTIGQFMHSFHANKAVISLRDIPNKYVGKPLKMDLAFWVDFKDEAYGMHRLHPFGRKEQGANGLVESLEINFEETGRILGTIPLTNRLYKFSSGLMGNRQGKNIFFWNLLFSSLILLLFAICGLWYILKKRRVTDPNSISITTATGTQITD